MGVVQRLVAMLVLALTGLALWCTPTGVSASDPEGLRACGTAKGTLRSADGLGIQSPYRLELHDALTETLVLGLQRGPEIGRAHDPGLLVGKAPRQPPTGAVGA